MARSQVTLDIEERHRDREITPTVNTELRREETEF